MGRPKLADPSAAKARVVSLKLTAGERARLDRLVQARAEELFRVTGDRITVTASSYLRWLMDKDARERELAEASETAPKRVKRSTAGK
jgi:hypothetical protein